MDLAGKAVQSNKKSKENREGAELEKKTIGNDEQLIKVLSLVTTVVKPEKPSGEATEEEECTTPKAEQYRIPQMSTISFQT